MTPAEPLNMCEEFRIPPDDVLEEDEVYRRELEEDLGYPLSANYRWHEAGGW